MGYPIYLSKFTTEKMHQVRLRHQGNIEMGTKTLPGQRHMVAWRAGSEGWCARGPQIESRGNQPLLLPLFRVR